jgi:hypothetical protein
MSIRFTGHTHTVETKAKMRATHARPEVKKKVRDGRRKQVMPSGWYHTAANIKKMSTNRLGKGTGGKYVARGPIGPCEICGEDQKDGRSLSKDHDHKTGKLRGKLCHLCNRGIGMFRDNPHRLRAAAMYLEKWA